MRGKEFLKKSTGILLTAVICFSAFVESAFAINYNPDVELHAKSIYMENLDNSQVVFKQNIDEKMAPASLTKIMTAILAIENIPDLSVEITYKPYIQDQMSRLNAEYGGISLGGLLSGEVLSAEKLLYATLLPSANEAATILADYVGDGSVSRFVDMMNQKAKELGCENTHFVNPHGLHDENQYSTARDMAIMAKYAMQNETFRKIATTNFFDGSPTNKHQSELYWNTTNKLSVPSSQYYCKGVEGIKTGTLAESGRHVVSTAKRGGYEYLLVVMGAPFADSEGNQIPINNAFVDSKRLYNWAFDTLTNKTIVKKGEIYNETLVNMAKGKEGSYLKLRAGEDFISLIPNDVDISGVQFKYDIPESVDAPIKEGDKVGEVHLILKGEELGTVSLEASRSVDRSFILYIAHLIKALMGSFAVKFIIVFALILVLLYALLVVIRYRNMKKYRQIKRHKRL